MNNQNYQKYKTRKKRKNKNFYLIIRASVFATAIIGIFSLLLFILFLIGVVSPEQVQTVVESIKPAKIKLVVEAPDMDVDLLTINEYSRPGDKLEEVNGIVIHYTGNPGTTAEQNRSYFESLKDTHETSASSHFVVGIEGQIIQCIPTTEISYASNERNSDTISIECCHTDKTGKFTQETYDSLVHMTAFLVTKFDLDTSQVIRHYDVTGKKCPLYYVEHEDAWIQFKEDVDDYIEKYGVEEQRGGNAMMEVDTSETD